MATMQDVIDVARKDLNDNHADNAKRRYPDADLIKYANEGLLAARNVRPDLAIGGYNTPWTDTVSTSSFPLDDRFRSNVSHYIVARAQMRDDENVSSAKAELAMKLFAAGLM